ncbi:hypothetical protein EV356DRAFT_534004 [Viridothelium virens]|uniref:Uncharacterized protein n=1 Tax=Viridothelium virens TaxID=1048519 RepID=A0A6A6H4T0_VIRVR|nr:hypothetical protein EV356DRAFT_534004 [Viridothelium virens]
MAKADCRWLQARLQSNQLEDIMRHTLFTDLVNYTKDMLVLDSKSLVAASRGRPDIFERAESSHLAQIWNSLSDRSTTKPNDIHYILGTLTNRNVRSLKNSSSQERMESILRTFTYVPADLMLTYDAQSMNKIINNNTWLPAFPKGGLLSEKTVLRVLPHGFELCIGDADSIASVYTLDRNWENPKLVFLCRPGATVAYEVETLRTATESSDTRAAMPSPNTCILILGSGNPQHDPPNCLHAVQLEVVCQEQQPVQLHYKSLLRLKVAVIEKIPSAPASYIELKETLPPHTRCIILHGSQASQASNAIEDCGSTAEPHGPSYQPPFGLTGTLAHYTFFRLAMFNVAAIFIPTIVALAYPHITHARIAGIVIAAICWLIAASAIDYLCEISLSLAWHAHYDATTPAASSTTTKPVPVSRFMRRFNAFMDEWNRAIVLNFPVSDDNVEDLRQGWGMRAASAEQILAGPGKGRSLRRYLVPAREDTMVDVENSTGDMAFGPYLKNSLASFYTRIEGLSEPTLRASWDSRILRRLGLARKLR